MPVKPKRAFPGTAGKSKRTSFLMSLQRNLPFWKRFQFPFPPLYSNHFANSTDIFIKSESSALPTNRICLFCEYCQYLCLKRFQPFRAVSDLNCSLPGYRPNAECRMQNAELWYLLCKSWKTWVLAHTFIMNFAFYILHFVVWNTHSVLQTTIYRPQWHKAQWGIPLRLCHYIL